MSVVAVSYDSVEVLKRFAKQRGVTFPLLSDPESRTIEAYGIRNREAQGSRIDGVPHPGTFIIGPGGVIVGKLFYEGYRRRHTSEEILAVVERLRTEEP